MKPIQISLSAWFMIILTFAAGYFVGKYSTHITMMVNVLVDIVLSWQPDIIPPRPNLSC